MKKILLTAAALILACSMVFAGGSKEPNADNSLANIQKKGVFVLGLDDSFPPLGFRNEDNEIVGYDIDVAREVCRRLGVELKCQPIDWNSKEQELNTGKIDCIWNGFTITDERKEMLTMSAAYLANAQVVVTRTADGYAALADFAGKKIGLQAGSSAADAVEDSPEFKKSLKQIVEFKDNLTALMDLEIGGVDGVVMDVVVANYSIATTGKPFTVVAESLSPEEYGIGFRKTDAKLCAAVTEALEAMVADGTMAQIDDKWFGTSVSMIGK